MQQHPIRPAALALALARRRAASRKQHATWAGAPQPPLPHIHPACCHVRYAQQRAGAATAAGQPPSPCACCHVLASAPGSAPRCEQRGWQGPHAPPIAAAAAATSCRAHLLQHQPPCCLRGAAAAQMQRQQHTCCCACPAPLHPPPNLLHSLQQQAHACCQAQQQQQQRHARSRACPCQAACCGRGHAASQPPRGQTRGQTLGQTCGQPPPLLLRSRQAPASRPP